MTTYKTNKYPHPTNLDGQTVSLSIFSDKKDLIGKIVTITVSATSNDKLNLENELNIINKSEQLVYATRLEEIFVRIIHVSHGCKARVEIIKNPLSNSDSNGLFFVHDTRSTPFYKHSEAISAFINNDITMNSDLLSYFKHATLTDNMGQPVDNDRDWIAPSFFEQVSKTSTKDDLEILDKLRRKQVISQELYDRYIDHYIPLSNIQEKILSIIDVRGYPRSSKHPYDPKFDQNTSHLSKCYSSYAYNNNHTTSRFFKQGDQINIIFENIHYFPLDLNQMSDYKEYDYRFGQIPCPMAWNGALYEDRDDILSSLQIGNIVRCQFEKLELKANRKCSGGGAWYFSIILIVEDTIYGRLRDFYYEPKEYNLQAGDLLMFKMENITEIPHDWPANANLNHFKQQNKGYAVSGCVCKLDDDPDKITNEVS